MARKLRNQLDIFDFDHDPARMAAANRAAAERALHDVQFKLGLAEQLPKLRRAAGGTHGRG
ncbi:hypothetical protein [Stenotrophomonas indicatrix]|uniref:hypothetical protein n=1 Tax=Stenotrophomonas indicatrix TaxID=2045451 RepID=UPI00066EA70E|nr:hypothetical protein [Stenotrophomonas indicatrix]